MSATASETPASSNWADPAQESSVPAAAPAAELSSQQAAAPSETNATAPAVAPSGQPTQDGSAGAAQPEAPMDPAEKARQIAARYAMLSAPAPAPASDSPAAPPAAPSDAEAKRAKAEEVAARIREMSGASKRASPWSGVGGDDEPSHKRRRMQDFGGGGGGYDAYQQGGSGDASGGASAHYGPAAEASITEKMEFPNSVVGVVIGRGGTTIRDMQMRTGAYIGVDREDALAPTHDRNRPRTVTLSGPPPAVQAARAEIEQMVIKHENANLARSSNGGEGGSSGPIIPESYSRREVGVPEDKVGLVMGKGGSTIRGIERRTAAAIQIPRAPDPSNPTTRMVSVAGPTEEIVEAAEKEILALIMAEDEAKRAQETGTVGLTASGVTVEMVPVPNHMIGAIIGKGGSTVREIQNTTGARVSIPSEPDPSGFRQVSVAGSADAVEAAKAAIHQAATSPPPPRDYDPYGYGYGGGYGGAYAGYGAGYDPNAYGAYDPSAYDPSAYDPNAYAAYQQGGYDYSAYQQGGYDYSAYQQGAAGGYDYSAYAAAADPTASAAGSMPSADASQAGQTDPSQAGGDWQQQGAQGGQYYGGQQ